MRTRLLLIVPLLVALVVAPPAATVAEACPGCREANDTESDLPRAYMYSILFMLSVPVAMVTGFGIGFYRLSRRREAEPADEFAEPADPNFGEFGPHRD